MAAIKNYNPAPTSSKLLPFELLSPDTWEDGPRIGRLSFPNRVPIETPHYVAISSRGAVPHLTQDMMRDNTQIGAIYVALEDCELL